MSVHQHHPYLDTLVLPARTAGCVRQPCALIALVSLCIVHGQLHYCLSAYTNFHVMSWESSSSCDVPLPSAVYLCLLIPCISTPGF